MNPTDIFQAFFWGGCASLTATWACFRLAETKDCTFGEMDIMFQKNIPARKFSKYQIDEDEEFAH